MPRVAAHEQGADRTLPRGRQAGGAQLSGAEGVRGNDIPPEGARSRRQGASWPAAPPFAGSGLEESLPVRNPERRGARVEPARGFADDYSTRQHHFEDGWRHPTRPGIWIDHEPP